MSRAALLAVLLAVLAAQPVAVLPAAAASTGAAQAVGVARELPQHAEVAGVQALEAVACMTPTTCVAVGDSGVGYQRPLTSTAYVVTVANGTPRDPVAVAGVARLSSVACPTVHYCLAVGVGAAPANDAVSVEIVNGTVTAVHDLGTYVLARVACASRWTCVATALQRPDRSTLHRVFLTLSNGVLAHVTPMKLFLDPITCPSGNTCYAVGWSPYRAQVPGQGSGRWSVERDVIVRLDVARSRATVVARLPRFAIARQISCATPTRCGVTMLPNVWGHGQLAWLTHEKLGAPTPLPLVWVDGLMCHAPAVCVIGGPGLPFPGPNIVVIGHGAPSHLVARGTPDQASGPMSIGGIAATSTGFVVVGWDTYWSPLVHEVAAVAATG